MICLNATILLLRACSSQLHIPPFQHCKAAHMHCDRGEYSQDAAEETQAHFSLKKAREVAGRKMADDPPTTA